MMTTYHFHMTDGDGLLPDNSGVECTEAEIDAIARATIRQAIEMCDGGGDPDNEADWTGWVCEVVDQDGETVLVMPFSDVIDTA